jgi:hypothetical protein
LTTHPSLAERVLGVHPPFEDPAAMLSQAYTALTGEQADISLLLAQNASVHSAIRARAREVGLVRAMYEVEPATLERSVVLNSLNHIFNERGAAYGTLLGALPLYQTMYLEHAEFPKMEGQERKALLIGSISPLSSAAFVTLSECVFQAEPWIVDPVGGRKQRHGNFVQANGLSLPADWSDSMHTVVTNRLLHMLVDTDGQLSTATPAAEQRATRIFTQGVFRVLEAGGHLMLCEQPPQLDMDDFQCKEAYNRGVVAAFDEEMRTTLEGAGFSNISVTPGGDTGGADSLFQPFDPASPPTLRAEKPGTLAIYAQKPR